MSFPKSAISFALVLICGACRLDARDLPVRNASELSLALASAAPGDVLILAKGTWPDTAMKIDKGGEEGTPLTIRAETPGETIFSGNSFLEINAPHVVVDGLYFTKGAITKDQFSVIHFKSHHGTVRNTAIVDYNPEKFEEEYYWVHFSGDDNLLERCFFKGKNNHHPLLGNAINDSRRNTIRGCHFKNIPHADANGREILRMWGPGKFDPKDTDGAYCVVEGNLFEHADGEGTEIISLKSNHNQVIGNTVISTLGCLNIRQGSHNLVKGNIILGQGLAGAQGLRMSGLDNTVEGNYVSGCDWGIKVSAGEYTESALTPEYKPTVKATGGKGKGAEKRIAKYPQVKDLKLIGNVSLSNIGPDLELGFAYKRHWPEQQMVLLPENCLIKDNLFIRPKGGESVIGVVPESGPPLDRLKFIPNHYENNTLLGGTVAYEPAAAGFKIESLPAGWNEEKSMAGFKPLTPDQVGPPWVVALRSSKKFPVEDDRACYDIRQDSAASGQKKKSKD